MKNFFRNLCFKAPLEAEEVGPRVKKTVPTVERRIGTTKQTIRIVEEATTAPEEGIPTTKEAIITAKEEIPTAKATVQAPAPEATVREAKVKALKTSFFRVSGIPPEVTLDGLKAAFLSAFPSEETGTAQPEIDTSRTTICSSCYGDGTNTAFVQFTPNAPDDLNHLTNCETRQVPVGNPPRNVTVDKDFHGLTQLYSPEGRHVRADIIAICGPNNHAYGSWTGRGNLPNMWLRDFFPGDFPKCRTMIYGHNTDLKSHINHTTLEYAEAFLEELAKTRKSEQEKNRPIVFIAHGFGGIVLAQAIVRASEKGGLHYPIFNSTRGMVFFGTSHRGFTVDDILAMPDKDSPREHLVKTIGEGSALQEDLNKFIKCCENFKIISFEEKHQTERVIKNDDGTYSRGGDYTTAVGPGSSALLLPSTIEEILPVEGDYSNIVRFTHTGDTSYTSVVKNVRRFTLHDEIEKGRITMYSAVINNETDALELILQKDPKKLNEEVDVEGKEEEDGNTLLHLAAREGHVEVFEMLLGNDTNVSAAAASLRKELNFNVANIRGYTPLHLAAKEGHENVVRVFQRALLNSKVGTTEHSNWEGYFDYSGEDKHTALHLAAYRGYEKVVEALIKIGANIEAKSDVEERALHLAAAMGHEKVVEILLEGGAFIEAIDCLGATPLLRAAYEGRKKVVEMLLNKGANIEAKSEQGLTALHAAILNDNIKTMKTIRTVDTMGTVRVLLDRGADTEVKDERGFTVLHAAAAAGNEGLVNLFLDKGLRIEARDDDGYTPLYLAAQSGGEVAVKLLLRRNANPNVRGENESTPLHKAAEGGHAKTVEALLEKRAQINLVDEDGRTPLHIAVEEGEEDVVGVLLKYGADTEVKDDDKYTPLNRAAHIGATKIAEMLLNGGAKENRGMAHS